ncbi:MAG: response regulator [Candidatus Thorarchaeota archaeon]
MKKIDVIIIEDHIDTQILLTQYFQANGVSCICAGNLGNGLKLLKEILPSILLVDILLPDKRGDSLIKQIKLDPLYNKTLVYLLTAIPYEEAMKIAKQQNVDGVISKPFNLEEIDHLIQLLKNQK